MELLKDYPLFYLNSPEVIGHYSGIQEKDSLLVGAGAKKYIFLPPQAAEHYKDMGGDFEILERSASIKDDLLAVFPKGEKGSFFVDGERITLNEYMILSELNPQAEIKNFPADLGVKLSLDELKKITAAVRLAEEAMLYIFSCINEGVSERDLAVELIHYVALKGGRAVEPTPVVAFNENTLKKIHKPSDALLSVGDIVQIELALVLDDLHSRICRTVCYGEKPGEEYFSDYQIYSGAFNKVFEEVKSGASGEKLWVSFNNKVKEGGVHLKTGSVLGWGLGRAPRQLPVLTSSTGLVDKMEAVYFAPSIEVSGKYSICNGNVVYIGPEKRKVFNKITTELLLF